MLAIINYFVNTPLLELIAVLFSVLYVLLAAKVNLWCWPAAFISTALYSYIFYDVTLFMDSLLNIYYLVMAIYGWYCWRTPANKLGLKNTSQITTTDIIQWPLIQHITFGIGLTALSLLIGYFMAHYTRASFPFWDSATTVFAVFATYLVTQRVLENWLYWIVIDFVSIYLYIAKHLFATAVLFCFYVLIAAYGYFNWRKTVIKQRKQQSISVQHTSLEPQ